MPGAVVGGWRAGLRRAPTPEVNPDIQGCVGASEEDLGGAVARRHEGCELEQGGVDV